MFDKPLRRRELLRGAGLLTAAALAPVAAGCASDDDALTFFFAANPEEADAGSGLSRRSGAVIPTSRCGRCCQVRGPCSRYRRFVPAASVQMS